MNNSPHIHPSVYYRRYCSQDISTKGCLVKGVPKACVPQGTLKMHPSLYYWRYCSQEISRKGYLAQGVPKEVQGVL